MALAERLDISDSWQLLVKPQHQAQLLKLTLNTRVQYFRLKEIKSIIAPYTKAKVPYGCYDLATQNPCSNYGERDIIEPLDVTCVQNTRQRVHP